MLAGCATTHPKDPLEKFNRVMFSFNDAVDRAALKPAAEAYSTLPTFVQAGVGNFFGNLADPWIAVNNLLQGKVADGLNDFMRFAMNTTFGLVGLWDIGSDAGLPKHSEDLGQTLGKWGVRPGPYVVLPLLGSSTLRDVIALPVDIEADPWHHVRPVRVRNPGSVLRAVDQRAAVLDASNLIEEAALDRYEFVRDAYLQRRQSKVYDGEPPSSAYEFDVGPTSGDSGASNVAAETIVEPPPASVVKSEKTGASETNSASAAKEAKQ
ncbi:MAG TPA: VacJ family lipoprotein [Noviherbaspirillum sp.]